MAEVTLKERLRKAALTVDAGKRSAIVGALAAPLKRWTHANDARRSLVDRTARSAHR